MESEKTERVNTLRAKKEVALKDAIRKVIKQKLKKSERKPAMDLAREKTEESSEEISVEVIKSHFIDGEDKTIVDVIKKHAAKLLKSKDKHGVVQEISNALSGCREDLCLTVNYVVTDGMIPKCVTECGEIFYTIVRVNKNGFVQLFWHMT